MRRVLVIVLVIGALTAERARGDVVVIEPVQVGGFFGGGLTLPDNDPDFQNYFVGYSTSPGGMRTPERRSFFWFDLSGVTGDITSATLELTLVVPGGLVFGKGPGTPGVDPIASDPFEEFRLGVTPFSGGVVTDPLISLATAGVIFGSMAMTPVAPSLGIPLGPPPPTSPVITLDADGLTILEGEANGDGDIVLTGWMPSWSFDARPEPSPPPLFFEASEYMFGMTDVHKPDFPKPKLTITFSPIPEPSAAALGVAVCSVGALVASVRALARRRRAAA